MRKFFGKKRTDKPSAGEAVSQFIDEESAERECEALQCNSRQSQETCASSKNLGSGNLKTFSLRFDNLDFSEHDSNIFSLNGNQNNGICTSKSASASIRHRKDTGLDDTLDFDNKFSLNEISGFKSKSPLSQRSEKRSKSHDSLDRPCDNLLLRKTEEISDFNFKSINDINVIKDNSFGCAVERLVLANEKRARSDDLFDTEMNLFSEIDLIESQTPDCNEVEKKLFNSVPFRRKRDLKERSVESKDENKKKGFWSKKFFNTVNFLWEQNENNSKRGVFTQLNMTATEDAKPKVLRERFVEYPKVPLEKDLETKQYLKDFFFYIIYIIFLTAIAMSMVSANMYYFTNVTATLFMDSQNIPSQNTSGNSLPEPPKNKSKYDHGKTLRKSYTIDDFWDFAESTMIDLFFWNFFYSQTNSSTDPYSKKNVKKFLYENQILGVPRLRQVRVRNDSCSIHPHLKRFFKNCYNYYSPFTEETRPIKRGMESSSTSSAWIYTKAEKLNTSYYWGEISIYGGGGYYLDLDISKEKTVEMIKELKENLWLSRATRALFIDFNLYNANVNLFCLCKIVLEFPPVGGIIPKADFHTLKLIRYLTTFDFFILGCEFLLILFACYYTWEVVQKASRWKTDFFFHYWNYLDLIIVLLQIVYIILNAIRYQSTKYLIKVLNDRYHKYTEFGSVKELQINFNNVVAVLLFASWIKLIRYLTFNKIMLEFKNTLQRSLLGIAKFFPMFLTVYIAFAFLANLLFGNQVKDYSTVWFSFVTLLQAFSGEFEYSKIQESSRILGPLFCVAFVFFIFFVFLNVFIAIINDAYSKAKSEVTLIRPKVGQYAKMGIVNLMSCCRLRKQLKKKVSAKKRVIFKEIRECLENAGFTLNEIKIFFSKYNINVRNVLHSNIRKKIMEDLELKHIDVDDSERQTQLNYLRRRMDSLSSRIDDMEMNLQPVIDKVDVLLDLSSSKKYS